MIWEGVYSSFEEILDSKNSKAYVNKVWVNKSISRLQKVLNNAIDQLDLIEINSADLKFLMEFILQNLHNSFTVVDFGGNLGQTGIVIKKHFTNYKIFWKVIEKTDFLNECQKLISLPIEINFRDSLDNHWNKEVDLAYFGSSLQYVEDWKKFLENFISIYNPRYIIISDAYMGDKVKSFCTVQKYYEDILPCWFLNLNYFRNFLNTLGYKLTVRENFITFKNKHYHPETNFPIEHQIPNALNLIFEKI